jgi:hypothetical protein
MCSYWGTHAVAHSTSSLKPPQKQHARLHHITCTTPFSVPWTRDYFVPVYKGPVS